MRRIRLGRVGLIVILALVGATVLPELLVIDAFASSGPATEFRWVKSLPAQQVNDMAAHIEKYPLAYRRAILAALPAASQAAVWQRAIANYETAHATMPYEESAVLEDVRELAVTETFAKRQPETLAKARALALAVRKTLGKEAELEIFYYAGPLTSSESALPLRVRARQFIRSTFSVVAAQGDCNCNHVDYSTDCNGWLCSQLTGCNFSYFGCGIWYEEACDGYCVPQPQ